MKSIRVDNQDRWRFNVTCHECGAKLTLNESELFTVSLDCVPIPIGAFDCPSCKKTCVIRNGDMPIHVYNRLPYRGKI